MRRLRGRLDVTAFIDDPLRVRVFGPNPASVDARPSFDWAEIPCAGRRAAQAEAQRQQETDTADAVWIYLQAGETKRWVARRTPLDPDAFQSPPRTYRAARDPLALRAIVWVIKVIFSN
jgi:hypothetical protein